MTSKVTRMYEVPVDIMALRYYVKHCKQSCDPDESAEKFLNYTENILKKDTIKQK